MDVLILGCGFTGQRVARRFLARGAQLVVTTRSPERLADLQAAGATAIRLEDVPRHIRPGVRVLHSIPADGPDVRELLGRNPARLVYLSSTAVYGDATTVDATTNVDGSGERAQGRIRVEQAIAKGPWSTLILRPAAIYGPGRGVQVSFPRGEYKVGDNYVSRIHVEDLASHCEAALQSELTGAFPVADEDPCTSREAAEFCAKLMGLPMPDPTATFSPSAARVTGNRRVDGSAIRQLLHVQLRYPSYRSGIPAALETAASL